MSRIISCIRCGHEKTWNGDDINCPFTDSNDFGENWNCGIIGEIRKLCNKGIKGLNSKIQYQYCEDQKYVTINIDEIINPVTGDYIGITLWVTWYKSRGATDAMWILDSDRPPKVPTFEELKAIIEYYKE